MFRLHATRQNTTERRGVGPRRSGRFLLSVLPFLLPPLLEAQTAQETSPAVRIREIYVPYEEFLERSREDPNGIVMNLEEYRELVLAALEQEIERPPPSLPPLDAVVAGGVHKGTLQGHSVRLRSDLEVRVARDGWVLCDLGRSLARPGAVTVDGEPGWILRKAIPASAKKGSPAKKSAPAKNRARSSRTRGRVSRGTVPPERDFLVLRGKGVHRVQILHSLQAVEKEDVWTIDGRVPRASTARLVIEAPGHAEGSSRSGFLRSSFSEESGSTTLELALGSEQDFSLTWRPRRTLGQTDTLLAADHRVTLLPRRSRPVFLWEARVAIERRKTDRLEITEPEGLNVVRLSGPRVHSFEREGKTLRVFLSDAILGRATLRLEGFIDSREEGAGVDEPMSFAVAGPSVARAVSNSGYLAICDPAPERLEVLGAERIREVALGEGEVPPLEGASIARLFTFGAPDVRLEFRTAPRGAAFEARAACLARVRERSMTLEGVYQVSVINGRVYRLELSLPSPWRFRNISFLEVKGPKAPRPSHGLRDSEEPSLEIEFARALPEGSSMEFRVLLDNPDFSPEFGWERREEEFRVPLIRGATRMHVDLGIALAPSIDARGVEERGWRALGREDLAQVGLEDPYLVAGLSSSSPADAVGLSLLNRLPRGEYEAVSHLLALERRVRVRADLYLTIVDRAVEEIRLLVPVEAEVNVPILGEGIREVDKSPGAPGTSVRAVRFEKPWLGTRQLRVEFEMDHAEKTATPIPALVVEGKLTGKRSIVFQSLGPVELEVEAGDGLVSVDLDEIPDFAEAWKEGRKLLAYRFRNRGLPGTFLTRIHPRAPVVPSFARELRLLTVIGPRGVSRTRASALLAYSGRQYLDVRLPPDSRLLEVEINGELVRSLRSGKEAGLWSIPLPPRSYADISLVYERSGDPHGGAGAGLSRSWGSWRESGPRFLGVPVGTTRWELHHPEGYRFLFDGGNLRPEAPSLEEFPRNFAEAFLENFLGRLLQVKVPILTTFVTERPVRRYVPAAYRPGPASNDPAARTRTARSSPRGLPSRSKSREEAAAPSPGMVSVVPQGFLVEASKIGGDPELVLAYRSFQFWNLSKRFVFLATLALGFFVARRTGRRGLWWLLLWGLVYGTLAPPVLERLVGWESPFLVLPFTEALFVLLVPALAWEIWSRLARRRALSRTVLALALGSLLVTGGSLAAAEPGAEKAVEEALIPYDPEELADPGADPEKDAARKVYLPYEKFRELWLRAHPDERAPVDPPADILLGNADYLLEVAGDTYTLKGKVALHVFAERWLSAPLPFETVKLSKTVLDGIEVGASKDGTTPFVAVRGKGRHELELELSGAVSRRPGVFHIATEILAGAATRLRAQLPAGARLLAVRSGDTAVETGQEGNEVSLDLGSQGKLELRWHFPGVEGQSASQLESHSLSDLELTIDGYRILRRERIRVTGEPVRSVEYRVLGGWHVGHVSAPELSEWGIAGEDGEPKLQIFFFRPVKEAGIEIRGWAPLGNAARPIASLRLESATRQESYFALRHGARRRWSFDSLEGSRRTTLEEVPSDLRIPRSQAADRVFHLFGSGQGESVAAVPASGSAELETDCVLVVERGRLFLSARSRYGVSGPGPFRQEVALPSGWKILTARGTAVRHWESAEDDERSLLRLYFKRRARTGDEILWSAELQPESLPSPLELPPLATAAHDQELRSETQHWTLAAADSLDLSVAEVRGLLPVPLKKAPAWVKLPPRHSYRFAFRSRGARPDYRLSFQASAPRSQLSATVVSFCRGLEEELQVNSRLIFRIRRAARRSFGFRLPPGAELNSVETRNQKSREVEVTPEGTQVFVALISPVLGEHVVDISYRIERADERTPVVLGPAVILDGTTALERVDHYVGVLRSGELRVSTEEIVGLTPLPAERLPYLPEGVAVSNLQPTYRATRPDWSLSLRPEAAEAVEKFANLVDLAELVTVLGGDGTRRTRAVFTLRNRELQFLEVHLPAKAELWGVTLGGRPVLVSRDSEQGAASDKAVVRVPLEHVGSGDLDLQVALTYSQPRFAMPALGATLRLEAPRIVGPQVFKTLWRVELPDGYAVTVSGGNVDQVTSSIEHATRVENILSQMDRLSATVKGADSARLREQAGFNLKQLEQALSDNVVDLESTLNRAQQPSDDTALDQRAMVEQVMESRRLLEKGQKALQQARTERTAKEAKKDQQRDKGPRREESYNFLENEWRGGREAPADERPVQSREKAAGQVDINALRETRSFGGFRPVGKGAAETAVERAQASKVQGAGLSPLPDTQTAPVQPALETPPSAGGARRLTFRRLEGDAVLELFVSQEGAWGRTGLAFLLVAAAVCHFLLWRRR